MARRTGRLFVISRYNGGRYPDLGIRDWPGGNGPSITFNISESYDIGFGTGQAQAYIKGTPKQPGQAQADIKQTYYGLGQAEALIGGVIIAGYGQAQALIKNTYNQHAQAQARIVLSRFVTGQAQATIVTTKPNAQATALIRQVDIEGLAQAQAQISRRRWLFGQAQADIKQGYYPWAQAQALITHGQQYGQASVYVQTGTLLQDSFTRTLDPYPILDHDDPTFPLENSINVDHPDVGPPYLYYSIRDDFLAFRGEYASSHIDGATIVTSGSLEYDWVDTYNDIHAKDVVAQADFWVSQLNDYATPVFIAVNVAKYAFGPAVYGNMYYDPTLPGMVTYLGGFFDEAITLPTLASGTWYTAKLSYVGDDAKFKVWARHLAEPVGWDLEETIPDTGDPGMVNYYADVGENFTGVVYHKYDNFNVTGTHYHDLHKQALAQAEAYITRATNRHAQARAVIGAPVTNFVEHFRDTYTRTTAANVIGSPDIGSYSIVSLEDGYVDGSVLTQTQAYPYHLIDAEITDLNVNKLVSVDIRFSEIGEDTGFILYARSDWASVRSFHVEGFPDNLVLVGLNSTTEVDIPDFEPGVWYRLQIQAIHSEIKSKIWRRDLDPEPGWLVTAYTNTTAGAAQVVVDAGDTVNNTIQVDNFNVLKSGTAPTTGQAQAYIVTNFYKGSGQAQAQIQKPHLTGQAQALIRRVRINRSGLSRAFIARTGKQGTGQAQASILPVAINRGVGNAQAFIRKPQQSAQAQAKILAFGQAGYAQARAKILAKTRTDAYGQAMGMVKGPAGGQAAALIKSQKYLVRYNHYDLPGYAQYEQLSSPVDVFGHETTYEHGSFSEYAGLQNKIYNLRMLVVGPTYRNVKQQVEQAMTMVRTKKGFAKLYVQHYDRHYLALTNDVTTEKAVGTTMKHLEYEVNWEVMPWLIGDTVHNISGTGTITTDDVGRTIDNGGWTPTRIILDGTNVTVSGYNDLGYQTGFISVSGAVTNLIIDTMENRVDNNGVTANSILHTPNYDTYIGPGKTTFVVTGATRFEVYWQDRWYL